MIRSWEEYLLRSVHQLDVLSAGWSLPMTVCAAYEEPHARAEAGSKEPVEGSDGVDVDRMGAVRASSGCWTCHCNGNSVC